MTDFILSFAVGGVVMTFLEEKCPRLAAAIYFGISIWCVAKALGWL
jgi:hypothetical protein